MRKRLTDQQISDVTRVMNGFSCIGDSLYTCEKGDPQNCIAYVYYYRWSMVTYIRPGVYPKNDTYHAKRQLAGNVAFVNSLKSVIKNIDSYQITDDWGNFIVKFKSFLPLLKLYIQTVAPTRSTQALPIPEWLQEMKDVPVRLNALQNAYYKALSTTFAPPQVSMGVINPACKPYLGLPIYQDLIDADLRIGAFLTLYEWAEIVVGLDPDWQVLAGVEPSMYCASLCDAVGANAINEIGDKAFDCFSYMGEDWNSFEAFMLGLSSTWNQYIASGAIKVASKQGITEWLEEMNPVYCEFSCYQQSMVKAVMEIAPPSSGDQKNCLN